MFLQFGNLFGVGIILGWFLGFTPISSFFLFFSFEASHLKDKTFSLSSCQRWRCGGLGLEALAGGSSHSGTLGLRLDTSDLQAGIVLRGRRLSSSIPGLHHMMPEYPSPQVLNPDIAGILWMAESLPFEGHWTQMTKSVGGRALYRCSLLIFTAKWKLGAGCQPDACSISGLVGGFMDVPGTLLVGEDTAVGSKTGVHPLEPCPLNT